MKSPSQSFLYWQVSTKALFAYWPPIIDELVPSPHCLPTHSLGNRPKYWQERGLPGKMRNSWVGPCWGNLPGKTEHREGKSFSAKIFHWRKIPLPSWIRDPGDLCCQNWGGHHHGQVQAQPSGHLCSNSRSRCCFCSAHEQTFSAQQRWSIPNQTCSSNGKHGLSFKGRGEMFLCGRIRKEGEQHYLPRFELLLCEQGENDQFLLIADLSLWGVFLLLWLSVCFVPVWATNHNFNSFNQRVMIISDTVDDEQITAKM